jgi:hypothetical protein
MHFRPGAMGVAVEWVGRGRNYFMVATWAAGR